jgi:hypothetical protein
MAENDSAHLFTHQPALEQLHQLGFLLLPAVIQHLSYQVQAGVEGSVYWLQ